MNNTVDIKNMKVAKRYATALIECSYDFLDEVLENLKLVDETIFQNKELKTFFLHPVVSLKDKKDVIDQVFKDKINNITYNFIGTLLDENRFIIFKSILDLYGKQTEKIKNMQRVQVISAVGLDDDAKARLSEKLAEKMKKQVILNYDTDESIMGGLVVKVEDKIIDLSLKRKFENLRKI